MSATPRARTDLAARFGVAADLPAAFLALLLVAILGGCTLVDVGRSGVSSASGSTGDSRTETDPEARVQLQAREALDRWEAAYEASGGASISFVGETTSLIGAWEPEVAANNRAALEAGQVEAAVQLADAPPGNGEVKWLEGSKVEVAVLSARAALADLVESADTPCAGCRPLVITDANLATGLVETAEGPAEAPLWVFTIEGSTVRVTQVAVDKSVTVNPPPWNADDPPIGISIDGARTLQGDKKLEVDFVGAPEGGDQPCGADYSAEAIESELAVVIVITEDRDASPGDCAGVRAFRTATVTLAKALGDRAVLEVRQGLPVGVIAFARN